MPSQTLGTLLIDVKADTQQLIKGFDRAENAVKKTTKTMTNSVKLLTSAFIGLSAVDLGKSLSRQADTMVNINSKLKLVTKSTEELTKAQTELFKIAQQTRTGFADNVDLFQRISMSTNELGLSQKEVLNLTESINKSLTISGTTAEGASALIMQLGQAFSSNFQAVSQELNTLKDQAPSLYQALLKGTGKTSAEFKKMAEDGELSSELIIDAIKKQEQAIDEDFGKMAKNISQSRVQINSSTTLLIGTLDKISGASESISESFTKISIVIGGFATQLDEIGKRTSSIEETDKAVNGLFDSILNGTKFVAQPIGGFLYAIDSIGLVFTNLGLQVDQTFLDIERNMLSASISIQKNVDSLFPESVTKKLFDIDKDSIKEATRNLLELQKKSIDIDLQQEKNLLKHIEYGQTINDSLNAYGDSVDKATSSVEKLGKETAKISGATLNGGTTTSTGTNGNATKNALTTSLSDWENYYQTIGDMSTAWLIKEAELRTQYVDLTEEQFKKVAEVAKAEYFDKLEEFSFKLNIDASGFDGVAKALISTSSAFAELGDEQKSFNKFSKEYAKIQEPTLKDKEKFNKAEKQHISNQLNGYSAIAGAIGGLYAKGERQASAFQAIQASIALVEGVTAILSQGKGDPYTAGARMAAMGATVASLLSSAKIAFGFGGVKTTTTSDAFSAQVENTGIGSTLGDSAQASESITSSLEVLEDFAQPQFRVLSQMNKSLFTIAERIGGLSSLLIQTGGFAFGEGFTASSSNREFLLQNKLPQFGTLSNLGEAMSGTNIMDKLFGVDLGKSIFDVFSGATLTNKVIGGLFGKSSSSSELRDYGINFNQALLTSAINQINGQAFQTIATTVTRKSWFKSSSSTTIQTFFRDLNEETERQFSLVLNDLYNTTIKAGEALDQSSKDVENSLSKFIVNIGKISTKGKTGAEIQEQISNVFSKIGDDIASTAFPELDEFQKVGEGMFTTLTRVATGMQEAEFFIKRLGGTFEDIQFTDILNKQGDVGFEALAQSIIKADEALFGFDNGVVKIIETLSGSAEELFTAYNTLEDVRVNLELTGQSAKNLSSAMIVGAGSIDALSDATDEYFENFLTEQEQLQSKTQQLNKEFVKLNVAMPTSVKGFKDLIGNIDTSTDAGAELYGRLISLSEGFSDVFGSIKDVEKLRNSFVKLGESVGKTINSLIGGTDKAQQQTNTIESFWKKRNEADELIAKNATLTSSEQARLSTLVGEINTLAGTIQSGSIGNSSIITDELIGTLSILEDSLDLQNEILKVNIVGINDDVNLLTGTERAVPNISNTINPNIPLGDSKDTLNAILDNIITMKDDLSDMLDNSNALINGFAVPKVEVIP